MVIYTIYDLPCPLAMAWPSQKLLGAQEHDIGGRSRSFFSFAHSATGDILRG